MKILIIRTFEYWNPKINRFDKFEKNKIYDLQEVYSDWLIENKFAIPFEMVDQLKSEMEFRGRVKLDNG